ncbi:1-(5-phosphoribosyl)-5-[(5-phosphoribosylamino)methylideneamino]imidazole-4-carboxamide isomerase [Candidatus Bathyarchaeota archaeon]|nr:1-(5-phosphoribosyl)-5-[(5-phosphoribosylamino)methylideneamino]imidazole-4-carboxamide isomerase [Candidatus Bathyarchaeota archaeon]MBS7612811.1 1-(5-phosphoribosyl)-5-[(5-phosphoribosylamino)methylideneamino]imidazole-4-carboxamide isomerase [Candidatus Bathyarchaeota archaeon]
MIVVPSIDLKDGRCVKLIQGRPGTGLKLPLAPIAIAKYWIREGASLLHVVDLNGAIDGSNINRPVIFEIIKQVTVPVQVGGGIRSVEDALYFVEIGVHRIILGTVLFEDSKLFNGIVEAVGPDKIIVALDAKSGLIVKRGWTETVGITVYEAVEKLDPSMFWGILYTDVQREGLASGVCLETLKEILNATEKPVFYAGGISSLQDIVMLKKTGVYGVILGRALYEKRFSLREAVEVAQNG